MRESVHSTFCTDLKQNNYPLRPLQWLMNVICGGEAAVGAVVTVTMQNVRWNTEMSREMAEIIHTNQHGRGDTVKNCPAQILFKSQDFPTDQSDF